MDLHPCLFRHIFGYTAPRVSPMSNVSKTAQVLSFFAQQYGPRGIPRKRLVKLAYMTDILARQYLGHSITDFDYVKDHYGPNARELPDAVAELEAANLAEQRVERDGQYRTSRLRDSHQPLAFEFSLGENEVLGYVADNYMDMELNEFIDLVVKETDPFTAVEAHGEPLPMQVVDNTMKARIGFDLEAVLQAERRVAEGDYKTLDRFGNDLRAEIAAGHAE